MTGTYMNLHVGHMTSWWRRTAYRRVRVSLLMLTWTIVCTISILSTAALGAETQGAEQRRADLRWREIDEADKQRETEALKFARVSYTSVSASRDRFLLIRRGSEICAMRFTSFVRKPSGKYLTRTPESRVSRHAEYDWYFPADGSGDFRKVNVQSGHRKVALIPLNVPMALLLNKDWNAVQKKLKKPTVDENIQCGPFKLFWYYPTGVQFGSSVTPADEGIELAPTRWRKIDEIDLNDSRLRWFRYDKEEIRPVIFIPLEDL